MDNLINNSTKDKLIIMLGAEWCNPCKVITPIFNTLHNTFKDIDFIKLDVNNDEEICEEIGYEKIPSIIYYNKKEFQFKKIIKTSMELMDIIHTCNK